MQNILVTGGTGNLGARLTGRLAAQGYQVSVLSTRGIDPPALAVRIRIGDLARNTGLSEATEGMDVIVHCASHPAGFQEVDVAGTQNLLRALDRARTKHFVYISIIGIRKSDYPYYRAKLAAEQMIQGSGIPCSILRAAQFHEFAAYILQTCIDTRKGNIVSIPAGMRFQSVSIDEVAGRLAGLCGQKASGLLPDFAGPEVLDFDAMARAYLEVAGLPYELRQEKTEDLLHEVFRSGINLNPASVGGKMTWQQFLSLKFQKR